LKVVSNLCIMPIRTKKWTGSKANQYVSRERACKKLQLSLPSFRKLCILKGIYPHDPRTKHRNHGQKRVYYHAKDIKNLRREPLLWRWRAQNTYRDKITKHKGRHNWEKVKRMQLSVPQINIDHLVRERYPKFSDALRDLDDCVTFVFLFASLPSGIIPSLSSLRRLECQRLCQELRHYMVEHGALTKAFLSVKGVYYQCRVRSKYDVTFVVPHAFVHSVPQDVDFRVLSSFLDFYQNMLKFVVYKLYRDAHMKYPPFGDIDYDLTNLSLSRLRALKFEKTRKINFQKISRTGTEKENETGTGVEVSDSQVTEVEQKKKIVQLDLSTILREENENSADKEQNQNTDEEVLMSRRKSWNRGNLFQDFKFLLNRETPQTELEFVLLAMGAKVVFEQDSGNKLEDVSITHHILDRNIAESQKRSTRQYVQPQWVFDCLNTGAVIPTEHYQPGVQCPPHLSPFVVYNDQSHKPSQAFVLEHWREVSKQFGGFVPSKKLLQKNSVPGTSREQEEKKKEEQVKDEEEEEEIGMDLDITDILEMKDLDDGDKEDSGNTAENGEQVEEFVDSEDSDLFDEEEEDVVQVVPEPVENKNEKKKKKNQNILNKEKEKEKQEILEKQRMKIANNRRQYGTKATEHSLAVDGIAADKDELMKIKLAKSMMPKRHRRTYEKIVKKKLTKSKHSKYMEQKRRQHERKRTVSK